MRSTAASAPWPATVTASRAALVVLGNSIALYNPPLRVAEEFAMLDVLSGGRLIAGFPVGTSMDTNYAYGTIPALTREKYAEAHDLIKRAWSADEPFAFDTSMLKAALAHRTGVQNPLTTAVPPALPTVSRSTVTLDDLVAEAQRGPLHPAQWSASSDGAALRVANTIAAKLAL